ncbi:uncharacterized protein LOC120681600 isoform X4 [Panicum virgatum]|nr:uncharacterized protein LOC120681600 isoform X4 [Panicum virgatum]
MMAYAHTIVFKFLCRLGKADERCARLELGCRYSAVRPTLVLGQHGGCVLFRDYAFGDLAQMIHAVYMRTAALGLRNAFGKPASEVFHQSSSSSAQVGLHGQFLAISLSGVRIFNCCANSQAKNLCFPSRLSRR